VTTNYKWFVLETIPWQQCTYTPKCLSTSLVQCTASAHSEVVTFLPSSRLGVTEMVIRTTAPGRRWESSHMSTNTQIIIKHQCPHLHSDSCLLIRHFR